MLNFTYFKANNMDELFQKLRDKRSGAVIWAGGTDLMLKLKHNRLHPQFVVDISDIKELGGITVENNHLHIGSCVKLAEIVKNKLVKDYAPLLARFAELIGSMEIRNIGTIGGNICSSRANCGVCYQPGCKAMTGDRSVLPCR